MFFFLITFGFVAAFPKSGTITKSIGGTAYKVINGEYIPTAGITVLVKLAPGEYRILSSGAGGRFGPIVKTFDCPGSGYAIGAYALLDNGQIQGGTSRAGDLPCDNTEDWSNSLFPVAVDPAENNPQNAGDTCPLQSVAEPINVTNGNMWLKQTELQSARCRSANQHNPHLQQHGANIGLVRSWLDD